MTELAYNAGLERGKGAGSWVVDGNTTEETARYLLKGIADGDPEIMDIAPYPLSGENSGESIPELSYQYGIDLFDDDEATRFEEGFDVGFWDTVQAAAERVIR